jgi:hypothetical protein
MFDQLSAEILASLIKGFPRTTTTTTTKQNVDPAVHFVYSRVKIILWTVLPDTKTKSSMPSSSALIAMSIYRVSHNTWDYKNALGRPLNDNIESWEVSHFEAKDHTFQTRGVRF